MKSQRITIRLPQQLKERLQEQAEARGYSATDLLLFIINDYLRNQQGSEDKIR